jgi:hypothetical protein
MSSVLAIVNHWNRGGNLCCKDGLKFLVTIMPRKQAERFNEWAYDELGCPASSMHRDYYELKLMRYLAIQ